jgi:hypothetical protein
MKQSELPGLGAKSDYFLNTAHPGNFIGITENAAIISMMGAVRSQPVGIYPCDKSSTSNAVD